MAYISKYGGLHTVWKESPLLVIRKPHRTKNRSKDFEVFIDGTMLYEEEILTVGNQYKFEVKELDGKVVSATYERPQNIGPFRLEFEVGHAIKRYNLYALKHEYFKNSDEVEVIINEFLLKRKNWNTLEFAKLRKRLDGIVKSNEVSQTYCDGFKEFCLALFDYDKGQKSFSDKLLVSNHKLLPWIDISSFALNVVSYIHYIQNQWHFLKKISSSKVSPLASGLEFFSTNNFEKLGGANFSKSKFNIHNILFRRDKITLKILDMLGDTTGNEKDIFSSINELNTYIKQEENLSYSYLNQREHLLLARVYKKFNLNKKSENHYKELVREIKGQNIQNKYWLREANHFLENQ